MSRLSKHPVHLGLGAQSISEPQFTGTQWYAEYGARHADDRNEDRLVSMHTFSGSGDMWEMHPQGSEVVVCAVGELTLVQEVEEKEKRTVLKQGEYVINEPGVWHTADVLECQTATALFITAGIGTQHRAR